MRPQAAQAALQLQLLQCHQRRFRRQLRRQLLQLLLQLLWWHQRQRPFRPQLRLRTTVWPTGCDMTYQGEQLNNNCAKCTIMTDGRGVEHSGHGDKCVYLTNLDGSEVGPRNCYPESNIAVNTGMFKVIRDPTGCPGTTPLSTPSPSLAPLAPPTPTAIPTPEPTTAPTPPPISVWPTGCDMTDMATGQELNNDCFLCATMTDGRGVGQVHNGDRCVYLTNLDGSEITPRNCFPETYWMVSSNMFHVIREATSCPGATASPTTYPTPAPTAAPSGAPTAFPTATPTASPTPIPTATPTAAPTAFPTAAPTQSPTGAPAAVPTASPTPAPPLNVWPTGCDMTYQGEQLNNDCAMCTIMTDGRGVEHSGHGDKCVYLTNLDGSEVGPRNCYPESNIAVNSGVFKVIRDPTGCPGVTPLSTPAPSLAPLAPPTPTAVPTSAPTLPPLAPPAPTAVPTGVPTASPTPAPTPAPISIDRIELVISVELDDPCNATQNELITNSTRTGFAHKFGIPETYIIVTLSTNASCSERKPIQLDSFLLRWRQGTELAEIDIEIDLNHAADPAVTLPSAEQVTSVLSNETTSSVQDIVGTSVPGVSVQAVSAPSVTQVLVPASGDNTPVSGKGDPHLQNLYGERFDLRKPGKHLLLHIPRHADAKNTLFRVEAVAEQLGTGCSEMYFEDVNVTGAWADAKQKGGFQFHAKDKGGKGKHNHKPRWMRLGKLEIKVSYGHTDRGILYLNFFVKHIKSTGFEVGGLLGEDDHTDAATPRKGCVRTVSLRRTDLLPEVWGVGGDYSLPDRTIV
ncbi:unnamed protein product [Prorocentrum cordatum]|uniref:Uncharacterized protein n=1 Tax=Prorocentrum cordatum TaxID=2364126 RepID=A0ABN9XSM6_9DINO|nr:unnamed protein product [Polarella glacialis]